METHNASSQPGGTQDTQLMQTLQFKNLVAVARCLIKQAKAPRIPLTDACEEAERALNGGSSDLSATYSMLTEAIETHLARARQYDWTINANVERPDGNGIPDITVDGWLPPGQWTTTWEQFASRYGYNDHRKRQLNGLLVALHMLKRAGCRKVMLGGSFVSAKPQPQDIDLCWFEAGMDASSLDPILSEDTITRREALGLDAHCAEDWKKKLLTNQCLWYEDEPDYFQFEPLPKVRAVGVLLLDPCQPLPEPDGLMPESVFSKEAE